MALPLARTNAEAHLYMDLNPCICGEITFPRDSSVVTTDDGDLASRYTGDCPRCGLPRVFTFRLPDEILMPPSDGSVRYGGPDPSELLDPGEWLWVADRYATGVPADPTGLTAQQRSQGRAMMQHALAAMSEVLKFIPDGADTPADDSFRTDRGREMRQREPGRFNRARLEAVRDVYADTAQRV